MAAAATIGYLAVPAAAAGAAVTLVVPPGCRSWIREECYPRDALGLRLRRSCQLEEVESI